MATAATTPMARRRNAENRANAGTSSSSRSVTLSVARPSRATIAKSYMEASCGVLPPFGPQAFAESYEALIDPSHGATIVQRGPAKRATLATRRATIHASSPTQTPAMPKPCHRITAAANGQNTTNAATLAHRWYAVSDAPMRTPSSTNTTAAGNGTLPTSTSATAARSRTAASGENTWGRTWDTATTTVHSTIPAPTPQLTRRRPTARASWSSPP